MKWIQFLFAWVCFALGIIGIFLPILPTTPFLLLAALLFSKSSPRFHTWLVNLPIAGQGVRDWQTNRVIRPRAKILCASMLILSLALLWNSPRILLMIKILITLLLTSVGIFVMSRKNYSK